MATIQNRPFSKDYRFVVSLLFPCSFAHCSCSGLINQSVVAGAIFLITISSHEYMRRKRRGKPPYPEPLGSVETWEFG